MTSDVDSMALCCDAVPKPVLVIFELSLTDTIVSPGVSPLIITSKYASPKLYEPPLFVVFTILLTLLPAVTTSDLEVINV